jgi:hypothetical protein
VGKHEKYGLKQGKMGLIPLQLLCPFWSQFVLIYCRFGAKMNRERQIALIADAVVHSLKLGYKDWALRADLLSAALQAAARADQLRGMMTNDSVREGFLAQQKARGQPPRAL